MNILFVAPMPMAENIGGIQRVSCVLAEEMIRQGCKVFFLYSSYEYQLRYSKFKDLHYHISVDTNCIDEAISSYNRLLKKLSIDCVIFQWIERHTIIWLKNTPSNIKIISVLHLQPFAGYGYERFIFKHYRVNNLRQFVVKFICIICPIIARNYRIRYTKYLLSTIVKYSDEVCLLSKRFIPRIKRIMPTIEIEKFKAINNPITFNLDKNIDISSKENIILFVGRIHDVSKNIYGFVDIWNELAKMNFNWRAIVVGDGEDLKYVKQYAIKKSVQRISFVGNKRNISSFYKKSKIILITSFSEGWSMALTEGMSYGCVPCAFDSYESLYDIIDNKKNGFIIPSFDNRKFVEQVQELINDDKKYEEMAIAAMQKISVFNPESIVSQWLSLINSIDK